MKKKLWLISGILIPGLIIFFSIRLVGQTPVGEVTPGGDGKPGTGQEGYAGTAACLECHDEQGASFAETSHGIAGDPRSPAAKNGCESCHGPGKAHVDSGDGGGGILTFGVASDRSPSAQSATCETCHSTGKQAFWEGSPHEERGVGCGSCHNVHGGRDQNLARESKTDICLQCHKFIASDLNRMSHHPIREGKIECSDCHNPHGTIADKMISANTVNEKCWECHAEKRGPFLFEHAPVSEDCQNCHRPHGSNNERLLVQRPPLLCQNCHQNSRHPGTAYAERLEYSEFSSYSSISSRGFDSGCNNCHSTTHGSNHPSGKYFLR